MYIRLIFFIGFAFLLNCIGQLKSVQAAWKTNTQLRIAQQALSLGQFKAWKQALQKGDKVFAQERLKMSLQDRNNAQLWLQLLWAKYYQLKGRPPAIRSVSNFEDKKALQLYIKRYNQSTHLLQKALFYQNGYNRLYTQAMDRSNLRSQVYLQASLSLSRDLQGQIRSSKIYVSFLNYVVTHWERRNSVKKRIDAQNKLIQKIKRSQKQLLISRAVFRSQQQKLAASIQTSRAMYETLSGHIRGQHVAGRVLLGLGIPIALAGAAGTGYGSYLIATYDQQQNSRKTEICSSNSNVGRCYTKVENQLQLEMWMLFGGGAAAVILGVVMSIVGGAMIPHKKAEDKALLKSHNKHLDFERKKRKAKPITAYKKRGFIQHKTVRWKQPPAVRSVVLGQWR